MGKENFSKKESRSSRPYCPQVPIISQMSIIALMYRLYFSGADYISDVYYSSYVSFIFLRCLLDYTINNPLFFSV